MGIGTLFCVTLPVLMRYGMGVRMCAPSMPLPAEPSTRLSRVVPHEACLTTSTSGMPYLAKKPFSLATISGAASVSAMKPSTALVVSGVAAAAYSGFGSMCAETTGRGCRRRCLDHLPARHRALDVLTHRCFCSPVETRTHT